MTVLLKRKESARRTVIAPKGLLEKDNYYIIGDTYVRVLTVYALPNEISEGFLAMMINDPRYHIDFSTEIIDVDYSSTIQKEINELEHKIDKSQNDMDREILLRNYYSLKDSLKQTVANNSRTINTVINIYVKANDLKELNDYTKELKEYFFSTGLEIRLDTLPRLQIGAMQKNSPLFIGNSLNKYSNYHIGLMLPSLTTAALWPFIFDSVDDRYGSFIGIEANTGGKIVFDQFAYLNDNSARHSGRTAGNMVIVGRTGMGKTTLINLLVASHIVNKRKVIWCDPENRNEGYTKFLGGNYIEFGNDNSIINIFDLKPITTDSTGIEDETMMYNTNLAISNVVEDLSITLKMLWPNITEDELNMLNEITVKTYRTVGIDGTESFKRYCPSDYPTFTVFSGTINEMIEEYAKRLDLNKKEYNALKNLQMKMRSLVGSPDIPGHLARYFNGITNIDMNALDDIGLVSFGTKHLFNSPDGVRNALLRLVFNYAWATCLSTNDETVFISDEDHTYILIEEIASIKAQFQRRARKYKTVTISGTQQVRDYSDDKIITHGKAIFDNSTYQIYFNLTKDGVSDLSKLVSLSDQEKEQLQALPPYTALFNVGNRKIPMKVLITDDERRLFEQ